MNRYLSADQQQWIEHLKTTGLWRSEWPTWCVIVLIYLGGYLSLDYWKSIGIVSASLFLVLIQTWYMSLQHELLHGHPTRWDKFNRLLGLIPFNLWYPYDLYKEQHLHHHTDQHLTDPILDPESNYINQSAWSAQPFLIRRLYQSNRTLLGRLLLGPTLSIIHITQHVLQAVRTRDKTHCLMWMQHFLWVMCVLGVIQYGFDFPIYLYILTSYCALSIALVRSFYEHRPADAIEARTVINEAELPFRLLFLDNNYHVIHHDLPHAPWFMLKTIFKKDAHLYLQQNQSFYYQGYLQMLRQHSLKSIDSPIHQQTQVLVRQHIQQKNPL